MHLFANRAGTLEYMFEIFIETIAGKAAAVDQIVVFASLFSSGHPSMDELGDLNLLAWAESSEGLAVYPPVDVVEHFIGPLIFDVGIMVFGLADDVFSVSWGRH